MVNDPVIIYHHPEETGVTLKLLDALGAGVLLQSFKAANNLELNFLGKLLYFPASSRTNFYFVVQG